MTKGIVIAAAWSGTGKTSVSLGLMAALVQRGLKVAPFKIGPDFIDPGHHYTVCGRISRNLDGWMLSRQANLDCFRSHAAGADIAIVEGVMGLFDSSDGASESGSTAQIAKWLGLPVLLIVDPSHMARSAAAIVHGFATFDPDIELAGVVFNKVASPVHAEHLRRAMDNMDLPPVLGIIFRNPDLVMGQRHLGLVTAQDAPVDKAMVQLFARTISKAIDLELLTDSLPVVKTGTGLAPKPAVRDVVRIGVARDRAFCFYYQDNLDLLESYGAELVFFSPLTEDRLPSGLDGLYFGGGYPELHAAELASKTTLRQQIKNAGSKGMPIYGECGGFIFLGRSLADPEGRYHSMCGCLPLDFKMGKRLRRLGYRQVTTTSRTVLGPAGLTIRGHEFHYSDIENENTSLGDAFHVADKLGRPCSVRGYSTGQTLASYIHLHWSSCPGAALGFVENCLRYKQKHRGNNAT